MQKKIIFGKITKIEKKYVKSATKLKSAPKILESYRDKNYNAVIRDKENI